MAAGRAVVVAVVAVVVVAAFFDDTDDVCLNIFMAATIWIRDLDAGGGDGSDADDEET